MRQKERKGEDERQGKGKNERKNELETGRE